jgi:hypothetical protein
MSTLYAALTLWAAAIGFGLLSLCLHDLVQQWLD